MKTKEEILDSMISNIKDTAGQIIYTVRIRELKPFIMDAMQQCADQQSEAMAVEFAEYILKHKYRGYGEKKISWAIDDLEFHSTRELYSLFQNDKGK